MISWEGKRCDNETLSIDGVSDKEHLKKNHAENVQQKLVSDLFIILVNNPKQPWHARNYFKNQIFRKRIIKKPKKGNFIFSFEPSPFQ